MTQTGFIETEEQQALRKAVAAMAANYGQDYYLEKARAGGHTDELWNEAGKLGFIGVNLPEQYGGGGCRHVRAVAGDGGDGRRGLAVAADGRLPRDQRHDHSPEFGTEDQKKRWLPGIADGSITMAFAITEPDAGSN